MTTEEKVKALLKYLKEEYGINSKEEFMEKCKDFKGIDISLFVGGGDIIENKNQVGECD